MEADPVLAVLLAIMAVEAHLQQFKEAARRWAEVVTAGRLQTCAAWAHFQAQFDLGGEGRLRPAQKFPDPNLGSPYTHHLEWFLPAQATMGDRRIYTLDQEECCSGIRSTFNWLVDALRDVLHRRRTEMRAPVSVERRVAVAVWWMANNMSYRAVAHQFGLARSTVAGIVVEVTGAPPGTEQLLERVVYLRDPDKDMSWSAIMSGGLCPCQLPSARPATTLNGLFEEVASAMRAHRSTTGKEGFACSAGRWAAVEEAGPAQGAHDPVVVVSSREGSPGEVRQPDLAAVMQVVEERLRTVELGMVNIRRTLNRHSYRLGFIQRGMVRQRNMLQRAIRPRQYRAVRRRAQQIGCGNVLGSRIP
ncbi:UNVERIFIED_CONTAM: hypothetical protein K2H54_058130 [Gekko kuhli]